MSSLSQNDISAIESVLALRSHDEIIDLDELVARTDDSIENLLGNSEIYGVYANRFIAHVNSEEEDHNTKR